MKNKKQNKQQQQCHLHSHLVGAPSPLDANGKWHDVLGRLLLSMLTESGMASVGIKNENIKRREKWVSNVVALMVRCHPSKSGTSGVVAPYPPCFQNVASCHWRKKKGEMKGKKTSRQEKNKNNNQRVWLEKTINNQCTCAAWLPGTATTITKTLGTETKEHRTKTIFLPPVHNAAKGKQNNRHGEVCNSASFPRYLL